EMSGEPALHRRTQRGRWHWQCVVKPPGVRRPLVHLRQHLAERQGHISIRWQQGDRAKRQRLIQRYGPDLGAADIPTKGAIHQDNILTDQRWLLDFPPRSFATPEHIQLDEMD